jgi:acetyl esterase
MPLDPQASEMLQAERALGLPPRNSMSAVEARALPSARPPAPSEEVFAVEDRELPGPDGDVRVRVYRPSAETNLPALVFFHGGGWVVGSIAQTDATCRTLANRAGCLVVSVDYRLAPEFRFPAGVEDCYAAVKWVAEHPTELGIDPARLAVGGFSAGANLAAVVALMARDRGGPAIAHQFLGYPITDCEFDTPSYLENAEGYGLSRADMLWFWDLYLAREEDRAHPYVSPMRAGDLTRLPPALVVTAEFDPLRDEAEAYARALSAAGVEVRCIRYDGMVHGFMGAAHVLDKGALAIGETAAALRAAFAATEPV